MSKHATLLKIEQTWKRYIWAKIVSWILLLSIGTFALIFVFQLPNISWILTIILMALLGRYEYRKMPNRQAIVQLINDQFDPSEYSTELVFDESLSGLKSLQRERVLIALDQQIPNLKFPIEWKSALWFGVTILFLSLVGWFLPNSQEELSSRLESFNPVQSTPKLADTVFVKSTRMYITPPAYTNLRRSQTASMNLEMPMQSSLKWEIAFEGEPEAVWIELNNGDSLSLKENDATWETQFLPKESGFYTFNYLAKGEVISSPYYQLQLIPDAAPEASISGIPQHQRLDYERGLAVDFTITLSDDYRLTDGYVIATVTKGSGESVMFREQKIPLSLEVKGKKVIVPMTFRPDDFGMEPGNELYFYATAFDNRQPSIQQSRTETYFFILKDTAQVEFSLQGALGVDLMPDFFRSQLQIIIDTEKLLEERPTISKKEFNQRSNELGFDQKQLRLKYGQFIGEEEDSGLEIESEGPEEIGEVNSDGSNVLQEFGHDHDHENEAGQLMDKGTEPAEAEQSKNPLQAYMHDHGDEETATFHTQTLKAKLKAALTEMWDAELYLRLFQPSESLPYQYRAQELLKEIKNHARIYVQRIGFDPPPVNEAESRLTGKMKQLNESTFQENQLEEYQFTAIRNGIVVLDHLLIGGEWSEQTGNDLKAAGDELAGLAIEAPGKYLEALNVLKNLLDQSTSNDFDRSSLIKLKATLEQSVPNQDPLPSAKRRSLDDMNTHFLNNLLKSNGSK
jgi:hypothetical protein